MDMLNQIAFYGSDKDISRIHKVCVKPNFPGGTIFAECAYTMACWTVFTMYWPAIGFYALVGKE